MGWCHTPVIIPLPIPRARGLGVLLALSVALAASPAAAQTMPPEPDQVVLAMEVEGWVETRTAKVIVTINVAGQGADAGKVRSEALKALDGLAPKAEWRIVSFQRSTDSAGLERTDIVAESRLQETALGGLGDKARTASKPGLQIGLAGIDFTPTLAEREATLAALREQIYANAVAELARLNAKVPGRSYRIRLVDFAAQGSPRPMPMVKMARSMDAQAAPAMAMAMEASGMSVEQRVVVAAQVVLATEAPK